MNTVLHLCRQPADVIVLHTHHAQVNEGMFSPSVRGAPAEVWRHGPLYYIMQQSPIPGRVHIPAGNAFPEHDGARARDQLSIL